MATSSIRLDQNLVEKATIIAKALNRTPPKQIEHWARIGEMMEDNPDLPYEFVRQAIIAQAERNAGKLEAYDFGQSRITAPHIQKSAEETQAQPEKRP